MGRRARDSAGVPDPTLWLMSMPVSEAAKTAVTFHSSDFGTGVYRVLSAAGEGVTPAYGQPTQAALIRLVDLIRTLCAPGMGWPSDRPQTPENILPYVSEEAEELLNQLQKAPALAPKTACFGAIHRPVLTPQSATTHHFLRDLLTACLWSITASSYEAMRLLEGVTAKFAVPSLGQGVRLLPVLRFESPEMAWSLDMVTQAPITADMALTETAQFALADGDLDGQSRDVHQWLQLLWQEVERYQPTLRSLRQGWEVALLLPQQPWHQGRLSLDLQLVGLPPEPEMSPALTAAVPLLSGSPVEQLQTPWPLDALLEFTDPDWNASFQNQALSAFPLSLPSLEALDGLEAEKALLALVTVAQARMVRAQAPGLFSVALAPLLTLHRLWLCWRWLVLQPDTPLMQLMGGILARCLSTSQGWVTGILQAHLSLTFQQDSVQRCLDLGTGIWCSPRAELAQGSLLVMQVQGPWGDQIWPSDVLKTELIAALWQASPVLQLLWEGTSVILTTGGSLADPALRPEPAQEDTTSVHIHLQMDLTFSPQTDLGV